MYHPNIDYTLRRGVAEWGKWGHTSWTQAMGSGDTSTHFAANKNSVFKQNSKKTKNLPKNMLFFGKKL